MRTKKSFSFDEEKEAEEIIANGFINKTIDYGKMYIIAKYLRDSFGYGEIRLEQELIKFCKEQDKNFNPVVDAEIIKKWIKSAMSYTLRKIKEIEFLNTIKNTNDRKILFVILVISKALKKGNTKRNPIKRKISDNYYIRYSNFSDINSMTKQTNISDVKLADILYRYKEHFTFYDAERELVRLEYTDKNPENIVTLRNMDNIVEDYNILFGSKKTISCQICGKRVPMTNGNQKYCISCAKEVRNEKQKDLMQKRRNI